MSDDTIYECYECGEPFQVNPDFTTSHAGPQEFGEVGPDPYDLDEDHIAFGYVDCFACGAQTETPAAERGTDEHGEPLGVVCEDCGRRMDDDEREAEHQADLLDEIHRVW